MDVNFTTKGHLKVVFRVVTAAVLLASLSINSTGEQRIQQYSPVQVDQRVLEQQRVQQLEQQRMLQIEQQRMQQQLEQQRRQQIEQQRIQQMQPVLISLDDTLRYVPFAALHDGEQYLSERYGLVVYTAAARRHFATRPRSLWRVAGMGVSESAGEGFGALPAVRRELNFIVREEGLDDPLGVLPGVVRLDSDFTPDQLSIDLWAGYPVVHIASHFKFKPGNEADSFLLLGADQRLTLADIQDGDYPLTGVDLLTLSACETAYGGRDAHGREIESFAVLAQQQGAKAEALRQTQVVFLRGGGSASTAYTVNTSGRGTMIADSAGGEATSGAARSYSHPYYWAPFILMGNFL